VPLKKERKDSVSGRGGHICCCSALHYVSQKVRCKGGELRALTGRGEVLQDRSKGLEYWNLNGGSGRTSETPKPR